MVYIPDLHISSFAKLKTNATVFIASRKDSQHTGKFSVAGDISFNPALDTYPVLTGLTIKIDLIQSLKCTVTAKTVEQVSSWGKYSPTIWITGRCDVEAQEQTGWNTKGCRYWLMACNNKEAVTGPGTPDVISMLVFNREGFILAHGTGPLSSGDVNVIST